MTQEPTIYYTQQEEPNRSCLLALRRIILEQDDNIIETQKWGMPCFCYYKKPFCYLWIDKKTKEPYVLMVEGTHLEHPKLEAGNRAKMKRFSIDPNKDIPIETLKQILQMGLALYHKGIVKIKR